MLQKICEQCGKGFSIYPSESTRRFCSQKCCKQFGQGPNAPNWRGGGISCTCGYCGKEFMIAPNKAKSGKGKYCSKECWHLGNSITLECRNCHNPFIVPKTRKNKAAYCSMECKARHMEQVQGKEHPLYDRIERICPNCGKIFTTHPFRDKVAKYCSKECYEQARPKPTMVICQNCGKEFLVHYYRLQEVKFCSVKCFKKYNGPTSIEQLLINELDNLNIEYEFQYPFEKWNLDFAFPAHHLAVEADGSYWHNLPGAKARDKRKDKSLKKQGWTVFRFGEDEIHQSPSVCIDKIIKFLDSHTQLHLF